MTAVQMLGVPTSIPLPIARLGVNGADGQMRFGTVADPVTGSGDVFYAEIRQTDPDTKGLNCKRVEVSSDMGSLQIGEAFTMTFKTRANFSGTTDQQIIWQWLKQGGQLLEMVMSDAVASLRLSLASGWATIWQGTVSGTQWCEWRVDCLIAESGFLKLRCNGVLLVDYLGPVGYDVQAAYWKVGLYKWDVWDMRRTERHMWLTLPDVLSA